MAIVSKDAARARELVLEVAAGLEGVSDDPAPRLLTQDLGKGARRLLLTFWVDSRSDEPDRVRGQLLDTTEKRLRDAGVSMALPES